MRTLNRDEYAAISGGGWKALNKIKGAIRRVTIDVSRALERMEQGQGHAGRRG